MLARTRTCGARATIRTLWCYGWNVMKAPGSGPFHNARKRCSDMPSGVPPEGLLDGSTSVGAQRVAVDAGSGNGASTRTGCRTGGTRLRSRRSVSAVGTPGSRQRDVSQLTDCSLEESRNKKDDTQPARGETNQPQ